LIKVCFFINLTNLKNLINLMKLCGLKAGVSLYRCVNIIHAGFILTLKGEVFSGI